MAIDCNKFSFVLPGHIFGWNLMKQCMGPLFDMLYREKWSNSVRRTVWRPTKPATVFFPRFEPFGVDLQKKKFRENFHPKILEKHFEIYRGNTKVL